MNQFNKLVLLALIILSSSICYGAGPFDLYCGTSLWNPFLGELSLVSTVRKIHVRDLCGKNFKKSDWDNLTPVRTSEELKKKPITKEEAHFYLQRFAKPGGYSKEYLPTFIEVSQFVGDFPAESKFAIQQIYLSMNKQELDEFTRSFYHSDYDKFQTFRKVFTFDTPPFDDKFSCRSYQELKETRKKSFKHALEITKDFNNTDSTSSLDYMKDLSIYMPSLRHLPEDQKMEIKRPMYRSLGAGLAYHLGITTSKAVVFTKNKVSRYFGEETIQTTDSTATNTSMYNNRHSYAILATDPIEVDSSFTRLEDFREYYGVDIYRKYFNPTTEKTASYSWKMAGKTYTAQARNTPTSISDSIDAKSPAPAYDKMWQDKKLKGVVLISDNLGEIGPRTSGHYLQYYTDQGFEFKEPSEIKDTKAWLGNEISSGNLDYVLKEAHSGGNNTSLMSITESNRMMHGVKTLPNGRKEEIYVLFPNISRDYNFPTSRQRLNFDEMKGWMNERKKSEGGGGTAYLSKLFLLVVWTS